MYKLNFDKIRELENAYDNTQLVAFQNMVLTVSSNTCSFSKDNIAFTTLLSLNVIEKIDNKDEKLLLS